MVNYKEFGKYIYLHRTKFYNIRMVAASRNVSYLISITDEDISKSDWFDKRWYIDA